MRTVTFSDIIGENGIFIDGDWVESKDQDPNGEVRLIQLADIGDGYFINKSNRFLTTESAEKLKCTFLEPGDILVGRMPDPLGRACIFPGIDKPCVTVVDVCIIRPDKKNVSVEWLKFLINSFDYRNTINKFITGTTRQRISRGNLAKLSFKLPPLPEQIRTSGILIQAENLITKRKESIALLDKLLKSTFLEMFGDSNNYEKKWGINKLNDLVTKLGDGLHGTPVYSEDGKYFFINGNNLDNGKIKINDLTKRVSELEYNKHKKELDNTTMLVSINGTIGKVAFYDDEKIILGKSACYFNVKKNEINTKFLYYIIQSDYFLNYVKTVSTGSTIQNLSLKSMRELPLPNPPLKLQNQFATLVEKVDVLKNEYEYSLRELVNMYGVLSQKAFKGELDLSKVNLELYKEDVKTPSEVSLKPSDEKTKFPELTKKEIKELKKLKEKSKDKIDITDLSIADFYGVPLDIQAKRENIDFDFVGDDLFYQFLLKDHFKNESFTSQDLLEKLHNQFNHNGNMDFPNDKWKNIIFQFLDAKPPLLEQIYDENDNKVKLKLTDEAYKA